VADEQPDWLSERTRETRAMAQARKRELLFAAQAGQTPPAAELLSLDRLEARLAVRERVERIRAATRSRGDGR
jgi:hypothetical protein